MKVAFEVGMALAQVLKYGKKFKLGEDAVDLKQDGFDLVGHGALE